MEMSSARVAGYGPASEGDGHNNEDFDDTSLNHPLLPQEEIRALIFKFQKQGDTSARARVVRYNLRLVCKTARKYAWKYNFPFQALLAVGTCAIAKAVEGFDLGRGTQFSTYAQQVINSYLATEIKKERSQLRAFRTPRERFLSPIGFAIAREELEEQERDLARFMDAFAHLKMSDRVREIFERRYLPEGAEIPATRVDLLMQEFGMSKNGIYDASIRVARRLGRIDKRWRDRTWALRQRANIRTLKALLSPPLDD